MAPATDKDENWNDGEKFSMAPATNEDGNRERLPDITSL